MKKPTSILATTKSLTAKKTLLGREEILNDFRLACESREASMLGRKEVFLGRAKFGIFGDGKEVAQIAMAKIFRNGDFRAGYYRDQTFMMAIGELTTQQYFAQLYAHTDVKADPASAGRLMNGHFATRMLDDSGALKNLSQSKNSSSDVSPTAAQMPRLLGLAYASKLFRNNPELHQYTGLSNKGNEIAFGTIGNASTSEGPFFETINAAGVMQVPLMISVWDDGYGISVPQEFHTIKQSISKALSGMQRNENEKGFEILVTYGWDYEHLISTYLKAEKICREEHVPVLVHVIEITQPQGHSTSGSHERYKPKERLAWEKDFDCLTKMKEWILSCDFCSEEEINDLELAGKADAKTAREAAWKDFNQDNQLDQQSLMIILEKAALESNEISLIKLHLEKTNNPLRLDSIKAAKRAVRTLRNQPSEIRSELINWIRENESKNLERYSSHLYSESEWAALKVKVVQAEYSDASVLADGREVLQACFTKALERDPKVLSFGEDVGNIGDVNQGFAGLQARYGALRVTDTGIRECTIVGQGIGMAIRGLRPIAEIQYLDYLLYAIQILSDDLATLQYRTKGGQKAPLIVRTRGHRLEGVWHAGSPMGMILNSLRGMLVLVPRNMTQAAGMYNTLFRSDDAALIIECLNGYRLKERIPDNIGEFTVPMGVPEVIREGSDITIVTYGSMCRIVAEAAKDLEAFGISCEIIDVQTLLPFDVHSSIVESVKKTSRVLFADEDVSGGATAYMMQKVVEEQGAFQYLDSPAKSLSAKDHRTAYGSDGDYFSKPSPEDVFDKVYEMMHEAEPEKFPAIY